ncbi:MAG: hypothetical protein Q7R92_04525 [bacterium]|nr:hypothetical protein [bacterium]
MTNRLKNIYTLIKKIKPLHRKYVLNIIKNESERFQTAPGGLYKHQNWKGGYVDHLIETMSIACLLYEAINNQRRLHFTLSDILYTLFFHDLEKIYKMSIDKRGRPVSTPLKNNPNYQSAIIIVKKLKIPLTNEQMNALKYVEGEKNDYHKTKRIMNPLAAFIHCCDTISARIWFDEPKKSNKFLNCS